MLIGLILTTQSGCKDDDPFANGYPDKSLSIILNFSNAAYQLRNLVTSCSTIPNSDSEPCNEDNFVNEDAGKFLYDPAVNPNLVFNEYYY